MAWALFRLLALIALVVMPLGITASPAAAHQPAAAAAGDHAHCGGQQAPDSTPEQSAHCALCAALPSASPSTAEAIDLKAPLMIPAAPRFNAIELEIATPPPKFG